VSDDISFKAIGVIQSPYCDPLDMPIQSSESSSIRGTAIIAPQWRAGLADLAGFDRVWLLWWAHRGRSPEALVKPFRDTRLRGVFATRVPVRPNPIAMSCVRLRAVAADRIEFDGVDMLDGTPLIDIKPYVWTWDAYPGLRSGWYDEVDRPQALADRRFEPGADHPEHGP
jgi:tRNA-Thr(GGU) m(6)t(6)A37 methyltransferase TsaA